MKTIAPPESERFLPVHDAYGPRLALVFGNQAPGGQCPYFAAGRCHHCDIGAGEGRRFTTQENLERLAWFQNHYADVWPDIAHLVLYNSGSTLNPVELAPEVLDAVVAWARTLPRLQLISVDSREAFVKSARLEELKVRPILGLESARESVRNEALDKRMSDAAIRKAFREAARAGCGMDCNVVIAGPGTTGDGVADAVETARFAFALGDEVGVTVDLNLHPYYPSKRGRLRFPKHGRCPLPVAIRAVEAIAALRQPGSKLFIGWQDEGHDQDQHVRELELEIIRTPFDQFNRTQDPALLRD